MLKPRTIINEVRRETKKLTNQLKRDKSTLVSSETLGLAIELSESIKADRAKAKKMKEDLKQTKNWPFPKHNIFPS
jgi:DNA polymerase elongation subunit (family B)